MVARFPTASSALQRLVVVYRNYYQRLSTSQRNRKTYFVLSVEIDPALAIKPNITQMGALVSTPGEHGQRYGDRYIDTNLPNIDLNLEFPSSSTGLGEHDGAIPIPIVIDDFNSIVQIVSSQNEENGSENFFPNKTISDAKFQFAECLLVTLHARPSLNNRRSNEVTFRVLRHNKFPPIKHDLSAFLFSRRDEAEDPLLRLRRNNGTTT